MNNLQSRIGPWAALLGRFAAAIESIKAAKRGKVPEIVILMLLTFLGLLAHGYHLGLEDEAVYLPAIKSHLDPALYPHDSVFFMHQMRFTIYPSAMALLVRLSHLGLERVIFFTHILSIFLVLLGCLRLSKKMFASPAAQWSSVTLITALLTLPVAGTALLLVTQYLHPRTLTTAFALFALVEVLDGRLLKAAIWTLAAGVMNPLLAFPGALLAAFLAWRRQWAQQSAKKQLEPFLAAGAASVNDVWGEVSQRYCYLCRWTWYELIGLVAPLAILFSVSRMRPSNTLPGFNLVVSLTAVFGLFFAALSMGFCVPPLDRLVALQPMRAFHVVYLILFLVLGGLVGEYFLKSKPLRWVLFFMPIFAVMFSVQSYQFRASDHIEWPGMKPRNQWVQAFNWVRDNTPKDAFFALDPRSMKSGGEDFHGFRALAERSMMCDVVKDPAVVSVMFAAGDITTDGSVVSETALKWYDQVRALSDWKNFGPDDFRRLKERFGVGWVILEKPGAGGLPCVYENDAVKVCRIE
ncbi:MAG: hypothetical protein ABSC04_15650 [Syntrophobacteraceae bacterium]|jgi:hypothetical protein